jgi:membrane fusion protein (multidrug efflux system)
MIKKYLQSKSPLAKRMIIMIMIVGILFGLIIAYNILRAIIMAHFFEQFKSPTLTISSAKATAKTWQPMINAVGTLVAVNGVDVTSQVSGQVVSIFFESGQFVKAGQPLIKLDDRTDQQDLKNFEASLKLSQINYQRQIDLLKTKSTAQSSVDQASAQLQEDQAQAQKTMILIDQKLIKAPFDGKIGIRQVNLGQYISPGTALVNLQSLNPLYAQFSLPEQYFKALYVNQPIEMTVTTYGDKIFTGKIRSIDSEINSQTRNLTIQAVIPNDQLQLYPGMSANINVLQPQQLNVITVPQTAIDFSLYGDSVFILVKDDKTKDKDGPVYVVHRRYVTTGERRDNEIEVTKGLKPGEEVVTSGQLKLDDGTHVKINNSVNINSLSPANLESND